jgi:Formate hydrogenlyase subunit 3/Multisubunit Na+/H+ antiporter, MnhD subunit
MATTLTAAAAPDALTAVPPGVVLLVVAVLVALLPRRAGHALGVAAAAATLAWVWTIPAGAYLQTEFLGFEAVLFNVDQFSRLMGIIFALIGVVAVLYSYASEAESLQTAFALSYVATSFGAVFAGDWLTLIFFWELMAVTSTLLVWHYRGKAVRAGYRYAIFHGIGGTLLLAAILQTYVAKGSFLFATVPGGPETAGIAAGLPAALAAVGIGVNVGFIGCTRGCRTRIRGHISPPASFSVCSPPRPASTACIARSPMATLRSPTWAAGWPSLGRRSRCSKTTCAGYSPTIFSHRSAT